MNLFRKKSRIVEIRKENRTQKRIYGLKKERKKI